MDFFSWFLPFRQQYLFPSLRSRLSNFVAQICFANPEGEFLVQLNLNENTNLLHLSVVFSSVYNSLRWKLDLQLENSQGFHP
mmetsp:Transcript_28756/g.39754  ORF Transcript_28756/g.39754 Transcript_28756/m.39754 type:complete len:82 (+) Transcript_28756:310-555(+)